MSDAPALAELQVVAWQAAYQGLLPQALLDGLCRQEVTQQWVGYLNDGVSTLVLEGTEGPQGFAGYGPARGDFPDTPTGEVYAIYLHPSVWGQGKGRSLFLECQRSLSDHGYNALVVWVLSKNARARAFYVRQGLVPDGRTKTDNLHGYALEQVCYTSR